MEKMPLTATISWLRLTYRHSSSVPIEITQNVRTGSSLVNSLSRRNLSTDAISREFLSVVAATGSHALMYILDLIKNTTMTRRRIFTFG